MLGVGSVITVMRMNKLDLWLSNAADLFAKRRNQGNSIKWSFARHRSHIIVSFFPSKQTQIESTLTDLFAFCVLNKWYTIVSLSYR